jgi:uncharacterized membrane protein
MSRRKRKKKREPNKQPRSPTIVPPLRKTVGNTPLPPGLTEFDPGKTVITSKEIFIKAPVEVCFGILSQQLEKSPLWDPIIIQTLPVLNRREQKGATSQLTLNLGGRELSSRAVISRYRPNGSISWVSSGKPKVREDWRLEPKSNGTTMHVNFALELNGWPIGRLLYKVLRHKKVENDLDRMLVRFKEAVESTRHD